MKEDGQDSRVRSSYNPKAARISQTQAKILQGSLRIGNMMKKDDR
jgi:hypothetical protein